MDKEGQQESKNPLDWAKEAMKPEIPSFGSSGQNDKDAVGNKLTGDYEHSKNDANIRHLGGNGKGSEGSDAKNNAAENLKAAEDGASKQKESSEGAVGEAKRIENNPTDNPTDGFYKKSDGTEKGVKGKVGLKGKLSGLKRKGPVAAIIAAFIIVATFMLGGQATLPFSMIAQFKESLDSIKVSNEARSETIFLKQLSNTDVSDNPIHQRYFGFGGTEFKIQDNQREKLKTQGIYVDDDFGGTGKTAMLFDDGSGKLKVLTANEGDIEVFKGVDPAKVNLDGIDADVDFSKFEVDVGNTMTFKTAYNTIEDFYYGYIAGSRNWRGSVGSWFDNITLKFIQSNKLTRNRFKDFQERVQRQNEGNTRSARRKAVEEAMDIEPRNMTSESTDHRMREETDPETGEVIDEVPEKVQTTVSLSSEGTTKAELRSKIRQIVESKMGGGSGAAGMAVNMTCSAFVAVGTVSLLVSAQEFLQVMQIVTAMFETTDKTEAGDGNDAPIHEMAESLTMQMPTTTIKQSDSDELEEEVIEGKEHTSAVNSAGFRSVYSNTPVDFEDKSLQEFNLMSHMNNVASWFGTSVASFSMCAVAKVTVAALDVLGDVLEIFAALATGGWSKIAQEVGIGIATNIGVSEVVSMITEELLPTAAKWFMKDLTKNMGGEALGNAIFVGAVMYMGNNHMLGGGSLASRTKYTQFSMEQQNLIAEEADFQRATRSPFDVTSKYTFMGSIFNKLAMIQTAKSPVLGAMGSIGQMVSSSVMAMLPSASAYDISKNLIPEEDYEKICTNLTSIDAVGDAACTPYIITDVSTSKMDPLEVTDIVYEKGGIDDEGNVVDGSNLANVIMDCNNRSMSSYGIIDQNVVQRHSVDINSGNSTFDNVVNGTIGAVPVVGSIVDAINANNELVNLDWEDGANCVARGGTSTTSSGEGAANSGSTMADESGSAAEDGGKWEDEFRYYQRFIEDQRLLESINPDYESPVTAFLEKKEAENPVDDSYEGILARQAGLTKEEVEDTLALLEYYQYINDYDPTERIAFGEEQKVEKPLRLDNESETKVAGVRGVIANLVNQVAFADVRNRTVTV